MDQRTDQHVVSFLGIKDVMRLEAKATIARGELVKIGSDAGKVGQQAKGSLETRMIGIGVVATEFGVV